MDTTLLCYNWPSALAGQIYISSIRCQQVFEINGKRGCHSIFKGKGGCFTKIYIKIMQDKCLNDMLFY